MTPTLCPHCGGHVDRCRCAAIRRAAFAEAADWLHVAASDFGGADAFAAVVTTCAMHFRILAHPKGAA